VRSTNPPKQFIIQNALQFPDNISRSSRESSSRE
jgi:hypothetical protein